MKYMVILLSIANLAADTSIHAFSTTVQPRLRHVFPNVVRHYHYKDVTTKASSSASSLSSLPWTTATSTSTTTTTTVLYNSVNDENNNNNNNSNDKKSSSERRLEDMSRNGADQIRKMDITERAKRAMLAEQVEDSIFQMESTLEGIIGEAGGSIPDDPILRDECVDIANQIKASQQQYEALVSGAPSALLNTIENLGKSSFE